MPVPLVRPLLRLRENALHQLHLRYALAPCALCHPGAQSLSGAVVHFRVNSGRIPAQKLLGAADLLIGAMLGHLPGVVLPFEYTTLLCPLVVVWYTLTELGSIVENAVNLGAPVPQWLKKMLSAAKDAVDKLGEEND